MIDSVQFANKILAEVPKTGAKHTFLPKKRTKCLP